MSLPALHTPAPHIPAAVVEVDSLVALRHMQAEEAAAEDRLQAARAMLALVVVAAHSPRLEDTPVLRTALDDQMDSPRATQVLHSDQWSWFLPLLIGMRREPTHMRADHPRGSGRALSISQCEGVHASHKSGSKGSLGKRRSKCGMLAHDRLWWRLPEEAP